MGKIEKFDLQKLKAENSLKIAVETGTFKGDGAKYLANLFETVYTIELVESCFNSADFSKFINIKPYLGKSVDILPIVLKKEVNTPCLFWLDAHLPSFHHSQKNTLDVELPLESELELIRKIKNIKNDVFIIDDLRIYEDGPFSNGVWSERKRYTNMNGIQFIEKSFQDTHDIEKLYSDEGYVILTPKK